MYLNSTTTIQKGWIRVYICGQRFTSTQYGNDYHDNFVLLMISLSCSCPWWNAVYTLIFTDFNKNIRIWCRCLNFYVIVSSSPFEISLETAVSWVFWGRLNA